MAAGTVATRAVADSSSGTTRGAIVIDDVVKIYDPDGAAVMELVVAPAPQDSLSQVLAEGVERAAERGSGSTAVELRPKHAQQGVTAVPGTRPGRGQIRQQSEAFRLTQEGVELGTVPVVEPDPTQHRESRHGIQW